MSNPNMRPLLLVSLLLAAACGPTAPAGSLAGAIHDPATLPAAGGALGMAAEASPPPPRPEPPLPVAVLHHAPAGPVRGASALVATFNQPMARLGPAAVVDDAGAPFRATPAVAGAFRWVAGDTAKLDVAGKLKNATRYRVTVPAGLLSLAGSRLDKPVSWSFETPRPRLIGVDLLPEETERYGRLLPGDGFLLRFSQAVAPQAVARLLSLSVGKAARKFAVQRHGKDGRKVAVRPALLFASGERVSLTLAPGLRGLEGPLLSNEAASRTFQVYSPLDVSLHCDCEPARADKPCWPMLNDYHGGLSLNFSEPVCLRRLLGVLRITPRPPDLARRLKSTDGWSDSDDEEESEECSETWVLKRDLKKRRQYRVRIAAGLTDVFGQRLGKPLNTTFSTRGLPPGVFLPPEGHGVREPWHPYKLKTVNLQTLAVSVSALRGARLVRHLECRRRGRLPALVCPDLALGRTGLTIKPAGKPDAVQTHTVPLPGAAALVTARSPEVLDPEGEQVVHTRLVTRASLGLQARLTAFGLVAWVSSLDKGKGLAGVEVEVMDRNAEHVAAGKTGPGGLLTLEGAGLAKLLAGIEPPRLHVFARKDGEEAHVAVDGSSRGGGRSSWYDGEDEEESPLHVDLGAFSAWEGERPILAGHISTERGIYRPGEPVYVHGAVRRYRSWRGAPLAGSTAEVVLRGAGAQVLARQQLKLSKLGVFTGSFPLPDKGRLGGFAVELSAAGQLLGRHTFRVAHYREPRFTATLHANDDVLADGTITPRVMGRYLFGGTMAGAAYRLSISQSPLVIHVPGHDEYQAGASSWTLGQSGRRWHLSAGVLDGTGRASPSIAPQRTPEGGLDPWPRAHDLEVEVTSAARRSAAARTWIHQVPGALYLGVKELSSRGTTVRQRVRIFEPRPQTEQPGGGITMAHALPRAGTVRATLYPHLDGKRGPDWSRTLWRRQLKVSPAGALLSLRWRAAWDTLPTVTLVLSVKDSRGREARTAVGLTRPDPEEARWQRQQARRERDQQRQQGQLTVATDRETYLPGQQARITVRRRGFSGDAVLFVERERVFRALPLRFGQGGVARVTLPVKEAYADSVTLRAVGLRAGKALRGRLGPLAVGSTRLAMSPKPFQLEVGLTPGKPVYRPGERVKVKVQVKSRSGQAKRAQVVIMAVDEAVLRLTRFSLPDPYHDLVRTPSDGVLVSELRQKLLSLAIPILHHDTASEQGCGGGGGFGVGGLGGGGGGRGYGISGGSVRGGRKKKQNPRRRFLTTAWHGTLVTDTDGAAEAIFTLPGNLTTYRLMALAVGEGRTAGSGSSSFRVDLPLLALPALPRFLRPGDRTEAGVVLYNTGLAAGKARITATVEGAAVALKGSGVKEVNLTRGASKEVRFALTALKPGDARLRFAVSMGGVSDALEQTLPVRAAVLPMAASVSGQTTTAVRQGVARLGDLLPGHGGLEVSLASTALAGVEDGLDQLIHYPYGCLEQQSSRVLALAGAVALGDRFRLKLPGDARKMIRAGLRNLLAMQRRDGGFGYWPGSGDSTPWLTAYALVVLHRLQLVRKASGVAVPSAPVERALEYLKPYARGSKKMDRYAFSRRAMILYALALHGRDVAAPGAKLAAERKRKPLFARAMLLAALALEKGGGKGIGEREGKGRGKGKGKGEDEGDVASLAREIGNSLRVDGPAAHAEEALHDGYQVLMHSNDRTSAMVLLALLSARPDHPMVPRLVRWFTGGRKEARFRNTQEAAWALLALWEYARLRERQIPDFKAGVWLGRKQLVSTRFKGHTTGEARASVPMADLLRVAGAAARELVIAKQGAGTLYYVARLRYAPRALPDKPRDHGLAVTREAVLLDAGGAPVQPARPPRLGETVLVTLKVKSSQARRYLVVVDPLPAGLEALDSSLATGSRSFGSWNQWSDTSSHDHRELRDDRVLFFRDAIQPGTLTYRYLARVTSAGAFTGPPARAEEMYTPEVFGHTAARSVTFAP